MTEETLVEIGMLDVHRRFTFSGHPGEVYVVTRKNNGDVWYMIATGGTENCCSDNFKVVPVL